MQTYLDTFDSLYKNTNKLRDKDDLSKKESEKLDKLTKLTLENDKNYSDFIKNNDIPEDYKSGAFKIKNYTSSLKQFIEKTK
ncbi:NDxxF motif lipoprotein [Staphylococcus simulans]|uniref:NDxxF motif lipoprotein n=1 Tax=Staphylococcus simulans TaxID=1286 RepID=UPI000D554C47|nr:NDxxF motif lipoprotein [Staphylococcus simulans]